MSEDLPNGWVAARLDEVADVRLGRQRSPDKATGNNLVPYLRAANVTWNGLDLTDVKAMQFEPHEVETYRLRSGDIVVVEASGSQGEAGKPAIWRDELPLVCMQNTLIRVRSRGPDPDYLKLRLFADARRGALGREARGVGIHHIGKEALAAWEVALPPLNEQRRIVAKLDALLARSKKAREHLDRVPALLDALKRSILAAGFRGDLTADWRKANPNVEPATKLLERIRAERRRRWEEELRAKGKDPKKAKYEEPASVAESDLPELPEGWCWATLGELSRIQGGIQKQPSRAPRHNAYPFLRVANIQRGRTVLDDVHTIELFDGELDRLRLERGDLLIVEGNGSESEIGRMAVWGGEIPDCVHQNHLIRVRLSSNVDPQVVEAFWNSPVGIEQVVASAVTTAGLFNLSVKKVARLPVPVIPAPEAAELRRRLDRLLARHEDLLRLQRQLSSASDHVDSAALQAAFRGELVPHDVNDEPADVMLVRLRAATLAPAVRAPRAAPQPKRSRPAGAAAQDTAPSMADALDLVVAALVASKRMTAEQIRAATGLGKDDVTPALKGLVAGGKVRVEGKARGTTYAWVD